MCIYYLEAGGAGLLASLAGLVFAGGIFLFFYALGGFGVGDVKLVGSLGALVGFPTCIRLVMYVAVGGGLIAVAVLAQHGALLTGLKNTVRLLFRGFAPPPERGEAVTQADSNLPDSATPSHPTTIPYGLAVFIGVCWLYLERGL